MSCITNPLSVYSPNQQELWQLEKIKLNYVRGFTLSMSRIKNAEKILYQAGNLIGKGNSEVYILIPKSSEKNYKVKAVKMGTKDLAREYAIVRYLYENVDKPPVGITLPFKTHLQIEDPNFASILVMPKYEKTLESWYPACPSEALDALIQLAEGLFFLKEKHVFHGDVIPTNVLYRRENEIDKFVLADFGCGIIIFQHDSRESIVKFLRYRMDIHYTKIERLKQIESDAELKEKFKELLFKTDAEKFCRLIEILAKKCTTQKCLKDCPEEQKSLLNEMFDFATKAISELETNPIDIETILQTLQDMSLRYPIQIN